MIVSPSWKTNRVDQSAVGLLEPVKMTYPPVICFVILQATVFTLCPAQSPSHNYSDVMFSRRPRRGSIRAGSAVPEVPHSARGRRIVCPVVITVAPRAPANHGLARLPVQRHHLCARNMSRSWCERAATCSFSAVVGWTDWEKAAAGLGDDGRHVMRHLQS